MKLSKMQREQHRGAARDLIERLERRLNDRPPAKAHSNEKILVERVGACKQQLSNTLCDRDLLELNLELADLFYRSRNADTRKRTAVP